MATKYWLDSNDNWNTPTDWTGGTVPGASDDAYVTQGNPVVTTPISVRSLTDTAAVYFEDAGLSQITNNLSNGGNLYLDVFGSEGGSSLTVGGTFGNTSYAQIGNGSLSAPSSIFTHYIASTGTIELDGSSSEQASLNVNFTAGFGTGETVTGIVRLFGDTLVSFSSGQIKTIAANSYLRLDGADAFIADAGSTGSNSALTGLDAVGHNSSFLLDNGASVTTTGFLTNYGTVDLDVYGSEGGSSLSVGTTLTNVGYMQIGNGSLSAFDAVSSHYISNTGTIELDGSSSEQASLNVNFTAGFGTGGVVTGTVRLFGDTLVSFSTGQIKSLAAGSYLRLDGSDAFIADAGSTTSNSALTGLNVISNGADLLLDNGASISATGFLTNHGTIDLDAYGSEGGSALSVGTTLSNNGYLQIGNGSLSGSDSVSTHYISNTGTIELDGSSSTSPTLNVGYTAGFGTLGTVTGTVRLFGDSLISFSSGQIKTLSAGSSLRLDGPDAFIADVGNTTSNSALTGLSSIDQGASFLLDNGASLSIPKNLTNNGSIELDYYYTEGSSSLTIGGALDNENYLQVGNTGLSAADSVTAASLTNNGTIDLYGSGSVQATLAINAAAGAGTAGELTGTVYLDGDTLLQFATGEIQTIESDGFLHLNGSNAYVADAGITTSNSALTGLNEIDGTMYLDNGAAVSTGGPLANYGTLVLDYYDTEGSSSLTVGGTLDNENYLQVGNSDLSAADSVTAASLTNKGTIDLYGSGSDKATLAINAAAGTGTTGELTGTVYLDGNTLLQFASGEIQTIENDGFLRLNGTSAYVADFGSTTSNSALTGLSEIDGTMYLEKGAAVSTSGPLANYGTSILDYYNTEGSSSLTIGGTLDNENYLQIGNTGLSAADSVTAASLTNNGTINLYGSSTATASLTISGSVTNNGSISVNDDTQDFSGAVTGSGTSTLSNGASLEFDASVASAQLVAFNGSDTLLLGSAKTFAAAISNFSLGDNVDLKSFGTATSYNFTENSAGTAGVLTISDKTHSAQLTFDGSYTTSSFSVHADGATGTLISHS